MPYNFSLQTERPRRPTGSRDALQYTLHYKKYHLLAVPQKIAIRGAKLILGGAVDSDSLLQVMARVGGAGGMEASS